MKTSRRLAAAAPVVLAVFGVAMAASSTPRPEIDRRVDVVRRVTGGDLSDKGLAAIAARMTPSELALAQRFDPSVRQASFYGLTPGWENLTLTGKPTLDFGETGLDALRLNASTPSVAGQLRPARPFAFRPASAEDRRRAQRCLTQAIYYEAALEPTEGQEAVAQVILNRVRDPNYANTVCGVVFQGAERTTGCQFSFTCDGALSQQPVAWAWDRARKVADRALAGYVSTKVGTATHADADAALALAAANGQSVSRTVEIDGQTRVVGVTSLGGRRQATTQDIAAINQRLAAFESPAPTAAPAAPPAPGVTPMSVEEVGRPGS
ncbi:MAG: cell wall hydrolase [Brevundimonas sp.]|nr:MAG: cell wall hydrolase [Brevundimonas sp.]